MSNPGSVIYCIMWIFCIFLCIFQIALLQIVSYTRTYVQRRAKNTHCCSRNWQIKLRGFPFCGSWFCFTQSFSVFALYYCFIPLIDIATAPLPPPSPPPRKWFFPELEFLKQSMGARNRVGIGLSYWPARLRRLAEFIPWNQFLGSLNVYKYGLCCVMCIWCSSVITC